MKSKSFLSFQSKVTEKMLYLQKEASQSSGSEYSSYRRSSVVSNSSFQFLNRLGDQASPRAKSFFNKAAKIRKLPKILERFLRVSSIVFLTEKSCFLQKHKIRVQKQQIFKILQKIKRKKCKESPSLAQNSEVSLASQLSLAPENKRVV